MNDITFGSRMRDLALALLNATLLLAVLLVFGLWLLIGRVQTLAADTAAAAATAIGSDLKGRLSTEIDGLNAALTRIGGLEGRIGETVTRACSADGAAVAELAALRGEVQVLNGNIAAVRTGIDQITGQTTEAFRAMLRNGLIDLANRLGPLPPA